MRATSRRTTRSLVSSTPAQLSGFGAHLFLIIASECNQGYLLTQRFSPRLIIISRQGLPFLGSQLIDAFPFSLHPFIPFHRNKHCCAQLERAILDAPAYFGPACDEFQLVHSAFLYFEVFDLEALCTDPPATLQFPSNCCVIKHSWLGTFLGPLSMVHPFDSILILCQ